MTYEEQKAAKRAADLAKPFLHEEDDNTKPATHAGYLNGLVYRVQKNPEDKDALAELLYTVYDDAALEIFPGKFSEGLTANESWTAEDTAEVIKTAQRIAALPLSNCVWPDDSDHTIEAAALRAQGRRLEGMPEEMIEELAWQHEHPEPEPDWWLQLSAKQPARVPGTTEATAQEPEPLDYLDTEESDDARHEEIATWLDQINTVQRFYAVGWPFYDHEQAARLTTGCQACGDDFAAMEQTMNTETKADREGRLIAIGAPCAAELIELQARRQTATPTEVQEMETKLGETYGSWFTEKPKPDAPEGDGYQQFTDIQARKGNNAGRKRKFVDTATTEDLTAPQ